MSELDIKLDIERTVHDRSGLVKEYLDNLPDGEYEDAGDMAFTLLEDGPLRNTVVIIPVAAHQEANHVFHTVSEYARQETDEPFSVVMHMNSPDSFDNPDVQHTLSEYERAKHTFPDLDLRMTYRQYPDAKIGRIRRDIWNAVAIAGLAGKTIQPENDIMVVNHDIDLVALPRHYMRKVQTVQRDPLRSITPRHTQARHADIPDLPNVSRVIMWNEAMYARLQVGYEAGTIVPMAFYAKQGGISADAVQSEVLDMVNGYTASAVLKTGWMRTSGRRFGDKLHDRYLHEVWSQNDFAQTEEYRESSQLEDIDEERLDDVITDAAEEFLSRAAFSIPFRTHMLINRALLHVEVDDETDIAHVRFELVEAALKQLKINRALLDRVMRTTVRSSFHTGENTIAEIYSDSDLRLAAQIHVENKIRSLRDSSRRRDAQTTR